MGTGTNLVTRKGLYAPFTASGTIVVNDGQTVSSFVSLQETSDTLLLLGNKWSTGISHQWLARTFEFPHRFWCNAISMQDCKRESYTPDGASTWVGLPLKFFTWFLESGSMIQLLLAVPILGVFGCFALLDYMATNHYAGTVFVGAMMAYLYAR